MIRPRSLAVVTGPPPGADHPLAKLCVESGYDRAIAVDQVLVVVAKPGLDNR